MLNKVIPPWVGIELRPQWGERWTLTTRPPGLGSHSAASWQWVFCSTLLHPFQPSASFLKRAFSILLFSVVRRGIGNQKDTQNYAFSHSSAAAHPLFLAAGASFPAVWPHHKCHLIGNPCLLGLIGLACQECSPGIALPASKARISAWRSTDGQSLSVTFPASECGWRPRICRSRAHCGSPSLLARRKGSYSSSGKTEAPTGIRIQNPAQNPPSLPCLPNEACPIQPPVSPPPVRLVDGAQAFSICILDMHRRAAGYPEGLFLILDPSVISWLPQNSPWHDQALAHLLRGGYR